MTTSPGPTHEVPCNRCNRKRDINASKVVRLPGSSAVAWVCDNEDECMAAAKAYVQATIALAVSTTLDLFVWPHERASGVRHECSTTGEHAIHVCACGWIWTSQPMDHTAPPPVAPPPDPAVIWPVSLAATETPVAAPVSGPPVDAKARLVATLAHLHDLSEEIRSIVDGPAVAEALHRQGDTAGIATAVPYNGDTAYDLAAAADMSRGVDAREVLAKLRRRRITGATDLPVDHPWCRVCGNYTAAMGAIVGDPPSCADLEACADRLVADAHIMARLSQGDSAS